MDGGRRLILESLRAALAFVPRAWGRPWFLIVVAASATLGLGSLAFTDPAVWFPPGAVIATLLIPPLAQAPLYTLALDEAPRETSLSGGAARYVRLVVVDLLTDIFLAIPALLIFVVGLGAAYGMAYSRPSFDRYDVSTWTASGPVMVGSLLVLSLGALAMLWLSARVALGAAATVVERRVLMISTWPLTRGQGWRIAIALFFVTAVAVVSGITLSLAVRAAAPASASRVVPIMTGVVLLGLGAPLKVGVLSYFYRQRFSAPKP